MRRCLQKEERGKLHFRSDSLPFFFFPPPNKVQLEEGFPPLPLGELAPRANRQLAGGALGEVRMD